MFRIGKSILYKYLDPNQLLTLFHELEDQNLSLIQNGQDMEENVEEIKKQAQVNIFFLIEKKRLNFLHFLDYSPKTWKRNDIFIGSDRAFKRCC